MPGGSTGRVVIVANSVSRNRFPRVKKKVVFWKFGRSLGVTIFLRFWEISGGGPGGDTEHFGVIHSV